MLPPTVWENIASPERQAARTINAASCDARSIREPHHHTESECVKHKPCFSNVPEMEERRANKRTGTRIQGESWVKGPAKIPDRRFGVRSKRTKRVSDFGNQLVWSTDEDLSLIFIQLKKAPTIQVLIESKQEKVKRVFAGGMQDYNYVWAQCLELTLELSCCKFPPADELPALWMDNRKALLAYIQQVHLGVKGRVFDGSGVPVQDAVVEVKGHQNMCPFRSNQYGEYYRLLLPGTYTFEVRYPDHEVLTETFSIPYGPDRYTALKHDFLLRRMTMGAATPPAEPTQANLTTCNYKVNLQGGEAMTGPRWSVLTMGLSLVIMLRSLII